MSYYFGMIFGNNVDDLWFLNFEEVWEFYSCYFYCTISSIGYFPISLSGELWIDIMERGTDDFLLLLYLLCTSIMLIDKGAIRFEMLN